MGSICIHTRVSSLCSGIHLCGPLALTRGADGCNGRTHPAWLSEHSQERVVEGLRGIVGELAALRIRHFFVLCIGTCFCGFRGFHGCRGANKPTLSVRGDE